MALYHSGISEAIASVRRMDRDEMLAHLDALYGRDNLPDDFTDFDLQCEAIEQTKREFTDTSSREYEQVQFWTKVHRASR